MPRLGELLVAAGLLAVEQVEQALRAQVLWGGRLGTNLIELGFVDVEALTGALGELYRLPMDDRATTTLAPDELILEVDVPAPEASTYLKAMDRRKWAFPLVGVAAARSAGETRIALAGVAPIPWLLDGPAALDDATPLPGTAYKVELARALVRRAVAAIS
jgi:CO/xanthine dehydrogenase FAD-binding subunit